MEISYHGHSVVKIKTNGTNIIIDPFIRGNGRTDLKVEEEKPDVILLTHGHNDHVGDTIELAKANNSLVIASYELAVYLSSKGVKTHPMGIGGAYEFPFGKVKYTPAIHGSGYETDNGVIYAGSPGGILFFAEGLTIYHAGDTALFSDMKLIGERNTIDVAFIPIGDNFTMGPEDAAYAVTLLKPKSVIPTHYNTFPVVKQDPSVFAKLVKNSKVQILEAGEKVEL